MGANDVNGLSWRKYLVNETEGINRSFKVFGQFLKDNVETKGGYEKVILVTIPPPVIRNTTVLSHLMEFDSATYDDRIKAVDRFNKALRIFCSHRSYCRILDIHPYVWSERDRGVYRPYVNMVRADTHLRPDRVFGLLLQQLRLTLHGHWCVKQDDKEVIGGEEEEVGYYGLDSSLFSGNKQIEGGFDEIETSTNYGFEPVFFDILCHLQGRGPETFRINAIHSLTPKEIVDEIASGNLIEGLPEGVDLFVNILKVPSQLHTLENALNNFLGESWGQYGSII
jgi:hypothetical protein